VITCSPISGIRRQYSLESSKKWERTGCFQAPLT
jgi:hypothetical protein